jgi:hypothetical protein
VAWKFPKRIPRDNQVVDYRDLNEGIQPYVEEDGRLNEQNWSSDLSGQLTRDDLADDVSFRVLHKSNIIDASDTDNGWDNNGDGTPDIFPFEVVASRSWVPIPMDGTNTGYSFQSRGGVLFIIASVQWSSKGDFGVFDTSAPSGPTTYVDATASYYTMFGIRIDGALEAVSVLGDQDSIEEGENMETGLSGYVMGATVEVAIPVGPGNHTIEVVAMTEVLDNTNDVLAGLIYNTELLVWEIR